MKAKHSILVALVLFARQMSIEICFAPRAFVTWAFLIWM